MPITITQDNVKSITKAVRDLARTTLHVGIPEDKSARQENTMNNATLGYIHEYGSPRANIPPRPWLQPGVIESKDKWMGYLRLAGKQAFEGKPDSVDTALHMAGTVARDSVKVRIISGITPALAESTKRRRQAKHKNTKTGTSELPQEFGGFTPLIDTGQFYNSITYVLRKVK